MKIGTSSSVQIKEFTTFANRCGAESAAVDKDAYRNVDRDFIQDE